MKNTNINLPAENKEFHTGIKPSFSRSFLVSITSTLDCCCFNGLSSDQIGQLNFSASAKYSASSGSGEIFTPSLIHLDFSTENTVICSLTAENSRFNSHLDNLLFSDISSQCLPISNKIMSGDIISSSPEKNSLCLEPFAIKSDMIMLASTTTFTQTTPIDLSCLYLPFLIFLPSSIANLSASSSDNSLFEEIASTRMRLISADCFNSNSNNLDSIAFLSTSIQFTAGNDFIRSSNSFGTSIISSAIFNRINSNYDLN